MTAPDGGRYRQYVDAVPGGPGIPYYKGRGEVLPLRADRYDLRFEGGTPSTTYDVFVGETPFGQVVTDAQGVALVSLPLGQGDARVLLRNVATGEERPAYVSVRAWATWAAALADVVELELDTPIADARAALAIASAPASLIEAAQGERVGAPNASAATIEGYRIAVTAVRQAYRLWGGRRAGLRGAFESVTSSTPLVVPRAWRPRFQRTPMALVPGGVLGGIEDRARPWSTTGLAALDLPALSFVHAAVLGTAALVFPGPLSNPPYGPARLAVRFALGYDGGDIEITGTDQTGLPVTEIIAASAYPTAAIEIVEGQVLFATVTRIAKALVGASASAVSVGLAELRFVQLLNFGPRNVTGARALAFVASGRTLSWGGGAVVALVEGRGVYTLGDTAGRIARVRGYPSTLSTADRDRLYVGFDGRGVVTVFLTTGAPTPTPAQVATDVEAWVDRDPRYGGARAIAAITITNAGTVANGETFTATDVRGTSATFEFNSGAAGAGNVRIDTSGGPTNQVLAGRVRDAVRSAGLAITAHVLASSPSAANLTQIYAGTAGNTTITDGGTTTGWTHAAAFAAGTNSPSYGAAGNIADAVAGGLGNVLEMRGVAAGGRVDLGAGPRSAIVDILGRPRARSTLSAGAALGASSLTVAAGAALPAPARPIQLVASFADDVATVAPTTQPGRATAVEVRFDPSWSGGALEVRGTDCDGNVIYERFEPAPRVVATGAGVESSDGGATLQSSDPGGFPTSIRPGHWVRMETGVHAGLLRQVAYAAPNFAFAQDLRLRVAFPSDPSDARYTALAESVVVGQLLFETITNVVAIAPSGGAVGTARVWTAGGEAELIPLEVGRDRVAQTATEAMVITPTTSDGGATATFDAPSLVARIADVGGAVLIEGATALSGANNGLHPVRVRPEDVGTDRVVLVHELAAEGKVFAAETTTGAATWTLYAGGQRVGMLARSGNTLTLAPPGLLTALLTGDAVEADLLPEAAVGAARGLGEAVVAVDTRFAPTGNASDNVTLVGETAPDGWLLTRLAADYGTLPPFGLRMVSAGGGDALFATARDAAGALELRGFELAARVWVAQHVSASEDLRIDVSTDGGLTWSAGTPTAIAGTPEGTPAHTMLSRTFELPVQATGLRLRVVHVGAGVGEVWRIDRVLIAGLHQEGTFLDANAVLAGAAEAVYERVILYWTPETLVAGEVDVLNEHAQTVTAEAAIASAIAADASVVGCYDEIGWAAATLEGMELRLSTPARYTHVVPSRVSRVEVGPLAVAAPSNATLTIPADVDGPFPDPPPPGDALLASGVGIPSAPVTNARGAAAIGAGANGTVTLTADEEGTGGNAWTVQVTVPAGTSPLTVTRTGTAIVVALSVSGGVAVTADNRALYVAAAIERAVPGVSAVASGTGATALSTASGPTAFSGADVSPWRYLSATSIQIASVAAGDPADRVEFDPTEVYSLQYASRIRATTAVIDLGTAFGDALWLVDAAIYRRVEPQGAPLAREVELDFSAGRRTTLADAVDLSRASSARIVVTTTTNDGTTLPRAAWRFVDAQTLEITGARIDPDAAYTLYYDAEIPVMDRVASVAIEARSATSSVGVASAEWRAVSLDEPVQHDHRYHQLRLSFRRVVDVRDVVVRSLGLRELRVYGADRFAPGILTCGE